MTSFSRLKPHLFPILVLVAATFIVYSGVFSHSFITTWDDDVYVTANEAVRGFSLDHLHAAFTKFYSGNYAPVQIISYMIDYTVWGMNPGGFLFSNVLYHAINGVLFYFLLVRIYDRKSIAFLAALIFLCHPVQVESVAWVSQRKNLLAMSFFLISFHYYLTYQQKSEGRVPSYLASFITFVLSLLAKAIAVIMAPLLLLYDVCFDSRNSWRQRILDKVPFVIATAAVSVVTMISQTPGRAPYFGGSPLATLYTMLPIFVRYLRMLVWPVDLSASYTLPVRSSLDVAVILSALFFLALAAGSFFLYRRRRDLFFWLALFFIGLIPVSQIVPIMTLINDRYLYFPILGPAVLIAVALVAGMDAAKGKWKAVVVAVAGLIVVAASLVAFRQAEVWENSTTLWSDVTSKYPNDCDAWNALGDSHLDSGNTAAALSAYKQTVSICESLGICQYYQPTFERIGTIYLKSGGAAEGKAYFEELANRYPNDAVARAQLGRLSAR